MSPSQVVGLSQPPDGGDAGLDEKVLRQVGDALLGDDQVGLVRDDVVADLLDVGLLLLEDLGKVLLLQHLDVGLALALLVLEVAVEQEDARVLDAPPHLGVRHVLVEHDAVEDAGVLDRAAWDQGCQMAKFDPFLSLDCTLAQSKERKGSHLRHSVAEPSPSSPKGQTHTV